jgi:type IV pilus biogenesis protein PilP
VLSPPADTPAAAPAPDDDDLPVPVFASKNRPQRALVAERSPGTGPAITAAPPLAAPPPLPGRGEPVFSRRTPPPVATPAPPPPAPVKPPPAPVAATPVAATPVAAAPVTPPAARPVAPGRISIDSVAPAARTTPDPVAPRITGVALGSADRPTVVPFAPPRPGAGPIPPLPEAGTRVAPFPNRAKPAAPDAIAGTLPARGKPRFLGLILTAILIVVLLIVALWVGRTDNVVSRLFGGDSGVTDIAAAVPVAIPLDTTEPVAADPAPDEVTTLALPPDPAAEDPLPITDIDTAAVDELVPADPGPAPEVDAPLPDAVAAAAAAAFVADAIAGLDPAPEAAPETAATGDGAFTVVTPEDADRFYAATGVWLRAPRLPLTPESDDLATLSLSAMDAPPAARDGVTLPASAPDSGLVTQLDPPPPGTRLPRDDRGFILATPEGTLTPNGLVIFAGSPAVIPPARPGTIAPEPAAPPPATEVATATDLPAQPLAEPPATRPQARTATFIASLPPEALGQTTDPAAPEAAPDLPATAVLPGGVSLAGLRPPARPGSIAALAPEPLPAYDGTRPPLRPAGLAPEGATSLPEETVEPEAVDPETALAQTLASIVEGAGDPLATATPLAVAVARRPDARPANFGRVVEQQSERLARATAAAQEQSAPASLGTPEESAETQAEEVEVAAAAPSGQVPRTVSEAATIDNAMALREINLIGVYGTPNDRRALVRLENGRYVRVSVGDSLDGGQVAAISDNTLNYVRRGRTITLEIPDG